MKPPNIVLIVADDLGFSDLGCFGGEIATRALDDLARSGVRMTQFYNTARCSPSRASLLTGRHPHETGVGILTEDGRPHGYPGTLSDEYPTISERLREHGYVSSLAGKWHLSADVTEPNASWPTRRGFDEFSGILGGAGDYFSPRALIDGEERLPAPDPASYYFTDAVTDRGVSFISTAATEGRPFFLYLAYTAPHWPLHAPEAEVAPYQEIYRAGWDRLREQRLRRARAEGVIGAQADDARDEAVPAWQDVADPEWEARRMAVYAAQVSIMDRGIGRIIAELDRRGVRDDTIVIFLSDNGATNEDLPPHDAPHFAARQPQTTIDGRPMRIGNDPAIAPGLADTFGSYGRCWANLSNTPFRLYKRWTHEGGIATPMIINWPGGGVDGGRVDHYPAQLTDLLPTLLDAIGGKSDGPGVSLLPAWSGDVPEPEPHPLFWEHLGNAAVRDGRWKAVREAEQPWELYDLSDDRTERCDLAGVEPGVLNRLVSSWQEWADQVGVIRWERIKNYGA